MSSVRDVSALDQKIGEIAGLARNELVAEWIEVHGHPPPKGIKRGLLERDLAYRLQARASGDLKPATPKALVAIARGKFPGVEQTNKLGPGARLVRDWNGVTHSVDVVASGYIWNGKSYRSLSAIARAITGAQWSGPRFFGL